VLPPRGELAQPGGQLEVLPGRSARDETADVGAVPGTPLRLERLAPDVMAADADVASRRRDHAGEHAHRRRFAGTVAPDERGRSPAEHCQVKVTDRLHGAKAHLE